MTFPRCEHLPVPTSVARAFRTLGPSPVARTLEAGQADVVPKLLAGVRPLFSFSMGLLCCRDTGVSQHERRPLGEVNHPWGSFGEGSRAFSGTLSYRQTKQMNEGL